MIAVPVFMIWSDWGLINSPWGLILLYVAVNLPFTIWLLYGFVLQVPVELEEAAAIDGCRPPCRVKQLLAIKTSVLGLSAKISISR